MIKYRYLIQIGTGCPRANFYWQLGTLQPGNILLLKKILFIYHLFNLPCESTARQVADIQMSHQLPGLINENKSHLKALDFDNSRFLSKWQFKKLAKDYVTEVNKN